MRAGEDELCLPHLVGRADADGEHPRGVDGADAGFGVLNADARGGVGADVLRGGEEDVREGLCALHGGRVAHVVEAVRDAELGEDERRVAADGRDGHADARRAQLRKELRHAGQNVRGRDLMDELFVELVFLVRERGLFLRRELLTGIAVFQNEFKALHAGDAFQFFIVLLVERDVQPVGQHLPRLIVVFRRVGDHAVKIKDDGLQLICFHLSALLP